MNYDQTGFGLCCGEPPVIGKLKDMYGMQAQCSKCGHRQGYLGAWHLATMRKYWNESIQRGQVAASTRKEHVPLVEPVLYKREGWRECRIDIDRPSYGHTDRYTLFNCLFLCKDKPEDMLYAHDEVGYSCAVDEGRHIHDIQLENSAGDQVTLQWQDGRRYPYSYVYASAGGCSTGTYFWIIHVNVTRVRDYKAIAAWITGGS